MGTTQAAALGKGRQIEVLGVEAQAGGEVVADEVAPGELLWGESRSAILPPVGPRKRRDAAFPLQPLVEAGVKALKWLDVLSGTSRTAMPFRAPRFSAL